MYILFVTPYSHPPLPHHVICPRGMTHMGSINELLYLMTFAVNFQCKAPAGVREWEKRR